jgi:hypothetical protein
MKMARQAVALKHRQKNLWISRGDRREAIFYDDADRMEFLRTLGQACVPMIFPRSFSQ